MSEHSQTGDFRGAVKPPSSLGQAGRTLWTAVVNSLGDGWDLAEHEAELLSLAARQADDLERLEQAIEADGAMVKGSQGQPVVNPAIAEARQGRQAISRLLGQLALPSDDNEPQTEAQRRATRAADKRWDRRDRKRKVASDAD